MAADDMARAPRAERGQRGPRAAEAAGLPLIDILTRDVDTPLSDLGREQSLALGRWFGEMAPDQRPSVVLSSPYVRARQTAELVVDAARMPQDTLTFNADERLREKEFGILDRLTKHLAREIAAEVPALMEAANMSPRST